MVVRILGAWLAGGRGTVRYIHTVRSIRYRLTWMTHFIGIWNYAFTRAPDGRMATNNKFTTMENKCISSTSQLSQKHQQSQTKRNSANSQQSFPFKAW